MQSDLTLPATFIERLGELYKDNQLHDILNSFCHEKPVSLRVNTLKNSRDEFIATLEKNSISVQPVPWYPDAFIYQGEKNKITSLEAYHEGRFYIQGLSSMIPSLILSPTPQESILDLAAAPGSKTTQIASLMHNTGKIIANDLSRARLFKLRDNLKVQGVTNVTTVNMPGERIWRKYPEYFDKVLVDAPCSMEGRISTLDPDSYKDWSLKKIKELSHRQQYLLRSAITATKVGGTIIYSTCTLSPEENEGVIDWILEKEEDNISLEPIELSGLEFSRGVTNWKNKNYATDVEKTARINPNSTMEGFFIAKIKKNKSTLTPQLFKKPGPKFF